MLYFKINDDEFVEVNKETKYPRVFSKKAISERKAAVEARLASIPKAPSDKELLEWAKKNYPATDYSAEVIALNSELADIKGQLEGASQIK